MSTKITDAYNALISIAGTALGADFKQISNPYKLEKNESIFLQQGFGVAIADGINTQRFVGQKQEFGRSMTLILCRQYLALEDDGPQKAVTEKQLFEDLLVAVKAINANSTLNGSCAQAQYLSDAGIEFVRNDREDFLAIRANISIEYFESLT